MTVRWSALIQKNSSQKLKTFTIGLEEQTCNEALFTGDDKYGKCLRYFKLRSLFPAFLRMPSASLLSLVHQLLFDKNPATPCRADKLFSALKENQPARLFNIITQAMTQHEDKRLPRRIVYQYLPKELMDRRKVGF